MPRLSSTAAAPAAPQTTLAPGAWPFGTARPPESPNASAAKAAAEPAEKPGTGVRAMVTFGEVKVEKGVPIPGRAVRSSNEGKALLESMAPGDMVRVSEAQAKALAMVSRRAKLRITTCRLSATELGVWRVE